MITALIVFLPIIIVILVAIFAWPGKVRASILAFMGWSFVGFVCMIPFGYAVAHGAGIFILLPLIFWVASAIGVNFLSWQWKSLKIAGKVIFFVILSVILWIAYYFFISPKLDLIRIKGHYEKITAQSVKVENIIWSWGIIGARIQANFTMDPVGIKTPSYPGGRIPMLEFLSGWCLYSWYEGDKPKIEKTSSWYILSVEATPIWVIQKDEGYCMRTDIIRERKCEDLPDTWFFDFPYIEWACSRWSECFTKYAIPWTEFSLKVDPKIIEKIPECVN
jgi:hypothetical protein